MHHVTSGTGPLRYNRAMRVVPLMLLVLVGAGCSKKSREGLPPATEWTAGTSPELVPSQGMAAGGPAMGGGMANPHGDMGGAMDDPHAGVAGAPPINPGNPHGDDIETMPNPHGGAAMTGGDPTAVDPQRRVAGTIKVHPKAKGHVAENGAVFVMAKHFDPSGNPVGGSLAVERYNWRGDSISFELSIPPSDAKGPIAEVVVQARFDQDSDAMAGQPGDVLGVVRAKIPAHGVELTLDTLVTTSSAAPTAAPGNMPAGHP
jgi:hypothetical protein